MISQMKYKVYKNTIASYNANNIQLLKEETKLTRRKKLQHKYNNE